MSPSSYKVVDYFWFHGLSGLIGVVLVEDKNQHQCAFIGVVEEPSNEQEDAQTVINFGTPFPYTAAQGLFPYLDDKDGVVTFYDN